MSWLRTFLLISVVAILHGCGQPHEPKAGAIEKLEGPDARTLSHEQLIAVLHECHQYGSSDDSRVKYTVRYCSAAQSTHAMEGYAAPSSAAVDPSINKLH